MRPPHLHATPVCRPELQPSSSLRIALPTITELFQQRRHWIPREYGAPPYPQVREWYSPDDPRLDPTWASTQFVLRAMVVDSWWRSTPGLLAAEVQRPREDLRGRYDQREADAHQEITAASGAAPLAVGCTASMQTVVGGYALPVPREATSYEMLGRPHHDYPAIDLPVPVGTPVYAVAGGTVIAITDDNRCGWGVFIAATDGATYGYCHASAVVVSEGSSARTGALLMRSGGARHAPGSGSSTGPHLHLQIEVSEANRCPQPLLQALWHGQVIPVGQLSETGCSY